MFLFYVSLYFLPIETKDTQKHRIFYRFLCCMLSQSQTESDNVAMLLLQRISIRYCTMGN